MVEDAEDARADASSWGEPRRIVSVHTRQKSPTHQNPYTGPICPQKSPICLQKMCVLTRPLGLPRRIVSVHIRKGALPICKRALHIRICTWAPYVFKRALYVRRRCACWRIFVRQTLPHSQYAHPQKSLYIYKRALPTRIRTSSPYVFKRALYVRKMCVLTRSYGVAPASTSVLLR